MSGMWMVLECRPSPTQSWLPKFARQDLASTLSMAILSFVPAHQKARLALFTYIAHAGTGSDVQCNQQTT